MPIFNFICKECGHAFGKLIPFAQKEQVKCPQCQGKSLAEDYSGYGSANQGCKNHKPSGSKFT